MTQKLVPFAGKDLNREEARRFHIYFNEFRAGLNTVQIAKAHKTTEAEVYNLLAKGGLA